MYIILTPRGVIFGPYTTWKEACEAIEAHWTIADEKFWAECHIRKVSQMS